MKNFILFSIILMGIIVLYVFLLIIELSLTSQDFPSKKLVEGVGRNVLIQGSSNDHLHF